MLHAVILAGGSGTRLWPLSRGHYPKQFLQFLGAHTLLQQTVLRSGEVIAAERVWVVTGQEQEFIVRSQLSSLPGFAGNSAHILVEPSGRNTAAAVGLAAVHIQRQDPHAVMVVLPADHWIERQSAFVTLIRGAAGLACRGFLVTLGIVPDRPETGYGYIRRGTALRTAATADPNSIDPINPTNSANPTTPITPTDPTNSVESYHVEQFVEKPDEGTAQRYLASGEYYWNGGIFLWQAATILTEIAAYMPALSQGLAEIARGLDGEGAGDTTAAVYAGLAPLSIDHGVLEKSSRLVVVPADIGWSDLGDWTAIYRLLPRDAHGNALSPHVLARESEDSLIYGNTGRTIAAIGVKNIVVIDTEDALLICPHDRVQEVKGVVQQLQAQGVAAVHVSRTVQRPWGTYTVLEEGVGFKVKRVVVRPGAALSLQLHHSRNEHWVVVTGVAQVINGELECRLDVGQSTYVPHGTVHRLSNPGTEVLEIIEVQTGSYLGEDDIVRFDDLYQRGSPEAVAGRVGPPTPSPR